MKTTRIILSIVLLVIFLTPTLLRAQPDFINDTSDVPIDGGLSLLVAAGIGYGAKKMRTNKPKQKSEKKPF
jgi:hypothetical protein